ncbi:hypothetical protein CAI16_02175 [Virgibacillus dokdonensis]|uniref:ABC-2 type transport system permease protein n=2 Tax=Virgibacillus TaxID=84406 RepID=A0A1M5LA25_9BACI|nr:MULTISPECIES: hypothetical protein [Virgibacillus]RFA37303.1 hypothetical protein CAI16_02175 [Virgibacillus dokdonensis]SHG61836.1 hypothetical protein SAMN05421807_10158 [Virgibacillus chiguensis]
MNRLKHHFTFDIKLLKGIYTLPFVGYIIALFLIFTSHLNSTDPYLPYIFLQGVAVPVSGLHIVFLYSYIYDEGSKEVLLPYYKNNLLYDLVRYSMLHGCILFLFTCLLIWLNGFGFFDAKIILHLLLLFVFYQVIGVTLLSLVESLELSIAIYATYTITEVVTKGTFLPWPHIFLFEEPIINIWLVLTFIFLILGLVLSIVQLIRSYK